MNNATALAESYNDRNDKISYNGSMESIDPSERILLLPHCMRDSKKCRAVADEQGLNCLACSDTCQVNLMRQTAEILGYKGICIAPGGSLALRYVRETLPRGIVAVACPKELSEGVENVAKLAGCEPPVITIIPLTKEGCIDTRINLSTAILRLAAGCPKDRLQQAMMALRLS